MYKLIFRNLWSKGVGYLYYGQKLDAGPEISTHMVIILKPLEEIYRSYYPELKKFINPLSLEYLRLKFIRGDPYIAVATYDDAIAHVTFIAKSSSYKDMYPLLHKEAYVIGPSLTKIEYRGRGIFTTVLKFLLASSLAQNGIDTFCSVDNISSQRGIEKAGFDFMCKYVKYTRFGISTVRSVGRDS